MKLKIFKSESAVSSVIGIVIILGLAILSISSMLIYSVPTLDGLEDMAKAQKVEQAFTVFDSRTSKVALGESPIQTTYVSLMGGTINVNGDQDAYNESKIVIVTVDMGDANYSTFMGGNNRYRWRSWEHYVSGGGFDELNCSLGTIEYSMDDRIIAYEGGGVWSKYPTGGTVMISPPEFHYNGETLTLPIMKINGRSGVSGTGDVGVSISSNNMPLVLFPNTTMSGNRVNPLKADKVIIYIKSEFYDAWANYADAQAYTSATVDAANKTAIIELYTTPPMGTSILSTQFKVGIVNQTNDAPMIDFLFVLEASGSSELNALQLEITATSGTKTLTYLVEHNQGPNNLPVTVTYEDTDYGIEQWKSNNAFEIIGSKEDAYALIDLLDESIMMECESGINNTFSWENGIQNETSFDEINKTIPISTITQHYIKLLTSDSPVIFTISEKQKKGKLDYEDSTLTLYYEGMPGAITYLHITKNELDAAVTV